MKKSLLYLDKCNCTFDIKFCARLSRLESNCQTLLDYSNERLLTTFLWFSSKESSPNFTFLVINSPSGFTTTKQDVRTSYIRRFSNSADTTMLCPATQGWRQWPVSVASGWPSGRLAGCGSRPEARPGSRGTLPRLALHLLPSSAWRLRFIAMCTQNHDF